jgi:N-acetylated-alpha-linked acidic dipeptidase
MGSGSDFTAFQDFAGVPSLDVGFGFGSPDDPVYHYHSNYDSLHWMEKYGDPGFVYHRTMAQIMGLISAQLVDLPVVSFRASDYARALGDYVKKVEDKLDASLSLASAKSVDISLMSEEDIVELRASHRKSSLSLDAAGHHKHSPPSEGALGFKKSLDKLYEALAKLTKAAVSLDEQAAKLEERASKRIPWWKWPKWLWLGLDIRRVNTKYKYIERCFLYSEGLDGRPWFKHVVFAPGLWTGYAGGKSSPPPYPLRFACVVLRILFVLLVY